MKREPALLIGAIQSLLVLFVSFGLDMSNQQQGALLAVSSAIVALMTRSVVYSPQTVDLLVDHVAPEPRPRK